MRPRTGTEYSDDFSLELARSSSAAPHRRFSSSVVFAGMAFNGLRKFPFLLLLLLSRPVQPNGETDAVVRSLPLGRSFLYSLQFNALAIGNESARRTTPTRW